MIMIQNVRAYILNRQEQMQRIVSYISFQRIPGEQPGIFCAGETFFGGDPRIVPLWSYVFFEDRQLNLEGSTGCRKKSRADQKTFGMDGGSQRLRA